MAAYLVWTTLLLAAFSNADSLGNKAAIEDFPSAVQVEVGVGNIWTQQCAAVVLTSYHLVSTASCFQGSIETRRARAGAQVRGTGGSLVYLRSANNHPDADFDSDISVISVAERLPLSDTIQQAPILGLGIFLPVGLRVVLAGWGTTAEGGAVSSGDLYSLDLSVTSTDSCAAKYYGERYVTENNMCVGLGYQSGRDYDARDLGAPLYYQGTLVGLLSYGKRDSGDEYPIITTAIGAFTEWIIANAV